MALGLLLPALFLGYLAGGIGLALGLGWLASLALVSGTGCVAMLLLGALVMLRDRPRTQTGQSRTARTVEPGPGRIVRHLA